MRSFHDAVILAVSVLDDELIMCLGDVVVDRGSGLDLESGVFRIRNVMRIEAGGMVLRCENVGSGFDDGQVLDLSAQETSLELTVEWQCYSERRKQVVAYRIVADEIAWDRGLVICRACC